MCVLYKRPNLNNVHNTDISNSELKMKNDKDNTIVDNESDKDNLFCIALLYRYRTHTFTQIFIECSRINYVFKSNCKNSMLFVRVIFVSGISNFVVTSCTVSISSTYCHELTARDAIFGLRGYIRLEC